MNETRKSKQLRNLSIPTLETSTTLTRHSAGGQANWRFNRACDVIAGPLHDFLLTSCKVKLTFSQHSSTKIDFWCIWDRVIATFCFIHCVCLNIQSAVVRKANLLSWKHTNKWNNDTSNKRRFNVTVYQEFRRVYPGQREREAFSPENCSTGLLFKAISLKFWARALMCRLLVRLRDIQAALASA